MKILQISNFFYLRGGDSRFMFDLSELLIKNGHVVDYFSMKHRNNFSSHSEKYFIDNLDYEQINKSRNFKNILKVIKCSFWNINSKKNIGLLLDEFKPDIVHLHSILHHITPSIIPEIKKRGIPIIAHLHDFNLICPDIYLRTNNHICHECFGGKYYNCVKNKCKKGSFSASIVAASQRYLHDYLDVFGKIDAFIVQNKFTYNKFKEADFKYLSKIQTLTPFMKNVEYKYQPQGLGMLFIGRFVVEKGIFVILEAAKLLKEYKFTFIGDGPLRAEIEEFILKNNMKNVKLKPWLNDEALQSEIIKYDAAVIPSIWYETVGIIVLEVGAKGIPSIISDNSAMCEIIEDKVDGLIFKMGDKDDLIDKIHYFYAEKERKFQLSQKMFTKITEKYNIINFYNNILNIYNKEIRKII